MANSNPTAIQERLDLTIDQVKEALHITGDSDDFVISTALEGARIDADAFVNNPFEDSDGNELAIPKGITLGVIFMIKAALGIKDQSVLGVKSEKAGDVARTYGDGQLIAINPQVESYFLPHRLSPGL